MMQKTFSVVILAALTAVEISAFSVPHATVLLSARRSGLDNIRSGKIGRLATLKMALQGGEKVL